MGEATSGKLDKGREYAREKNYLAAVEQFTSMLSDPSPLSAAFYYRGCAYSHLARYDEAITDFTSAISSPDLSGSHELLAFYKRGYARMKTRQYDAALDDYKMYINLCKLEPAIGAAHQGYFQMGILFATANRHNQAIQYFTDAIELSQNTEEDTQKLYYLYRGRAYACDGQDKKAKSDLEKVVKESNDLFIQGCAYNELGKHEEALQKFSALLPSDVNRSKLLPISDKDIYLRLGLCHASLHSHEDAVKDFQTGVGCFSHQEPSTDNDDRLLFRKGMSNQALNDSCQAIDDFNESISRNKCQPDVYHARSALRHTLGQQDAAVRDLSQALQWQKDLSSFSIDQGTSVTAYNYFQEKIDEITKLLAKTRANQSCTADFHRMMAESFQRQASYSSARLSTYRLARAHIDEACQSSTPTEPADLIERAAHQFCVTHILNMDHATVPVSAKLIDDCMSSATRSIMDMNELFSRHLLQQNQSSIGEILRRERDRYLSPKTETISIIRYEYLIAQENKANMIEDTAAFFKDSPAQQEFYTYLVIRLCNLFDAIRVASTSILTHALTGKLGYVAKSFELIGAVLDLTPLNIKGLSTGICCVVRGLNKLDHHRSENTFKKIGTLMNLTKGYETANTISKKLTEKYEEQIKRFPRRKEDDLKSKNQETPPQHSCCEACCARCYSCFSRGKNKVFNTRRLYTLETIADFAVEQMVNILTSLDATKVESLEAVTSAFIMAVCRPSLSPIAFVKARMDKIEPKENKSQKWTLAEFFQRPAIVFGEGEIWARERTDHEKFGTRRAFDEEKYAFENDQERLRKWGFRNHQKESV